MFVIIAIVQISFFLYKVIRKCITYIFISRLLVQPKYSSHPTSDVLYGISNFGTLHTDIPHSSYNGHYLDFCSPYLYTIISTV